MSIVVSNYSLNNSLPRAVSSGLVIGLVDAFSLKEAKWNNAWKDGVIMGGSALLTDSVVSQWIPAMPGSNPMIQMALSDGIVYSVGEALIRGKKKWLRNFLMGGGASLVGTYISPTVNQVIPLSTLSNMGSSVSSAISAPILGSGIVAGPSTASHPNYQNMPGGIY